MLLSRAEILRREFPHQAGSFLGETEGSPRSPHFFCDEIPLEALLRGGKQLPIRTVHSFATLKKNLKLGKRVGFAKSHGFTQILYPQYSIF